MSAPTISLTLGWTPKVIGPGISTAAPKRNPYDISTWGAECGRGIKYVETGAPVAAGTPNQDRKISTGRKHRGMASG